MSSPYTRQYEQTQVMTSSGVQLIVLLYDGAIQSIELARQGMQTNNVNDKGRFLGRAISIVGELNSVLDFERGGEIARSLNRLYDYMMTELVQANLRNDPKHLDGPLRCLTTLREGWRILAQQQTELVAAGK
ncbi:Flagellin-specific chaperone FliS [Nitrospira sp. KM1]|uniref:flagellar export chaperone FliS n=1 Tax=Nitrospira sp. KM1 TaxID=1936990 RepID=UPI0013A72C3C|nr:flagellar export chaperone FliS [Nitrospira sp. KM1]BCA54769.1 Flagellin-specific chaperone FliS [Nitrospira sp. KM1]